MQHKKAKIRKIVLTSIVAALLLTVIVIQLVISGSGNERYFSGAAEQYRLALVDAGFPSDYAAALTELHLLHPEWNFVPLLITEDNRDYTWDYVIERETEDPKTNLISPADTYKAYRHKTNQQTYDSGYYQASTAAVEYFMDPRNFLNETDIFLFYDIKARPSSSSSKTAVNAVLEGTFMENAVLENGLSYTDYFCQLGEDLGVDPVYLAAKIRQEQGASGSSPLISGKCGSKLLDFYRNQTEKTNSGEPILPPAIGTENEALLASLDNYYNFFNIKATGNGVFEIYKNAMLRAKDGTADMAPLWGSAAWNTKWKSLYGGTYMLKNNYIDYYQSTVYLQKFSVDSRAGDKCFTHQYMQSVSGGLTEARSLFQSFAAIDELELPYTFLIPVYGNMPKKPCEDPAGGECAYLAPATGRYSYRAELTSPTRRNAQSAPIYTECEAYVGEIISVKGVMTHDYGIHELQYAWDFGEWKPVSPGNQLNFSPTVDFSENSTHILVIRGRAAYDHGNSQKKSNAYFLCAVIYVKVTPPPSVTLSYRVANTTTDRTLPAGTSVTLPKSQSDSFAGWLGSDGSFLPSGASCTVRENLTFTAVFLDFRLLPGASLATKGSGTDLRFSAVLDEASYQSLSSFLSFSAKLQAEGKAQESASVLTKPLSGQWHHLLVTTAELTPTDYNTPFTVEIYANLHYTDGQQKSIEADGTPTPRSAKQVAQAALDDPNISYSPDAVTLLERIAG